MESDGTKLLWDLNTQTNKEIQARRPDLVVVNRGEITSALSLISQCLMILEFSKRRRRRLRNIRI